MVRIFIFFFSIFPLFSAAMTPEECRLECNRRVSSCELEKFLLHSQLEQHSESLGAIKLISRLQTEAHEKEGKLLNCSNSLIIKNALILHIKEELRGANLLCGRHVNNISAELEEHTFQLANITEKLKERNREVDSKIIEITQMKATIEELEDENTKLLREKNKMGLKVQLERRAKINLQKRVKELLGEIKILKTTSKKRGKGKKKI